MQECEVYGHFVAVVCRSHNWHATASYTAPDFNATGWLWVWSGRWRLRQTVFQVITDLRPLCTAHSYSSFAVDPDPETTSHREASIPRHVQRATTRAGALAGPERSWRTGPWGLCLAPRAASCVCCQCRWLWARRPRPPVIPWRRPATVPSGVWCDRHRQSGGLLNLIWNVSQLRIGPIPCLGTQGWILWWGCRLVVDKANHA